MVEPRRITWQPCFAESYQTRSVSRRLFCQRDCLVNTGRKIEKLRTSLNNRSCQRTCHKSAKVSSEPRLAISRQNSTRDLSIGDITGRSSTKVFAMQQRNGCSQY